MSHSTRILQFRKPSPGHINCVACHKENVPLGCILCRRCEWCGCRCRFCEGCKTLHTPRNVCEICSRCLRWCKCRKAPQSLDLTLPKGNFFQNPLSRWIGLEIELTPPGDLEHLQLPAFVKFDLVRDGSIPLGKELVTRPLIGDQFLQGITSLAKGLYLAGSGVTKECGFHVHVGAKDYGAFELRRLLTVYTRLEREIFTKFTTPERVESRFCKPYTMKRDCWKTLWGLSTGPEIRRFLIEWLYAGKLTPRGKGFANTKDLRKHKYEECRYHGLNLHSWMQRNTIEWRHYQGTIDPERLVFWPLFCGWCVEICGALRDSETQEIQSLSNLLEGSWKRPSRHIEMPQAIQAWTRSL